MSAPGAPRASVVVATWNWSSALRLALVSALRQTVAEIEVIVVGDACTDDSADVVAAFADPRLVWHNRTQNSGSQAAPNDDGLALARSPWVAYLGHDDLWHPRHLEDLLACAERRGADLVHSVTLNYGPLGSGVVVASGVEPSDGHAAPPNLRPSSVAHRRELAPSVGGWGDARATDRPIDDAFFERLWKTGARFAGTGRVTAFKFPAAWRRDSYRLRDVAQQTELLERLANETDLVERELSCLLVSLADGRGGLALDPDPPGQADWLDARRRFKGLEPLAGTGPAPGRVGLDRPLPGLEWHAVERDEHGPFRWSAALSASLELPWPTAPGEPARLRIGIAHLLDPGDVQRLEATVDGFPARLGRVADEPGGPVLEAELPAAGDRRGATARLVLRVPALRRPRDLDPASRDLRPLGAALRWAEIVPAA